MQPIQKLIHYRIRVPKKQSAFTYFILEANEGLCFHSTVDYTPGVTHRDIDIKSSIDFTDEIAHILNELKKQFPIEIITKKIIDDGPRFETK